MPKQKTMPAAQSHSVDVKMTGDLPVRSKHTTTVPTNEQQVVVWVPPSLPASSKLSQVPKDTANMFNRRDSLPLGPFLSEVIQEREGEPKLHGKPVPRFRFLEAGYPDAYRGVRPEEIPMYERQEILNVLKRGRDARLWKNDRKEAIAKNIKESHEWDHVLDGLPGADDDEGHFGPKKGRPKKNSAQDRRDRQGEGLDEEAKSDDGWETIDEDDGEKGESNKKTNSKAKKEPKERYEVNMNAGNLAAVIDTPYIHGPHGSEWDPRRMYGRTRWAGQDKAYEIEQSINQHKTDVVKEITKLQMAAKQTAPTSGQPPSTEETNQDGGEETDDMVRFETFLKKAAKGLPKMSDLSIQATASKTAVRSGENIGTAEKVAESTTPNIMQFGRSTFSHDFSFAEASVAPAIGSNSVTAPAIQPARADTSTSDDSDFNAAFKENLRKAGVPYASGVSLAAAQKRKEIKESFEFLADRPDIGAADPNPKDVRRNRKILKAYDANTQKLLKVTANRKPEDEQDVIPPNTRPNYSHEMHSVPGAMTKEIDKFIGENGGTTFWTENDFFTAKYKQQLEEEEKTRLANAEEEAEIQKWKDRREELLNQYGRAGIGKYRANVRLCKEREASWNETEEEKQQKMALFGIDPPAWAKKHAHPPIVRSKLMVQTQEELIEAIRLQKEREKAMMEEEERAALEEEERREELKAAARKKWAEERAWRKKHPNAMEEFLNEKEDESDVQEVQAPNKEKAGTSGPQDVDNDHEEDTEMEDVEE